MCCASTIFLLYLYIKYKKNNMWVYKITNLVNNKCYIGITTNLEKRWASHKKAINYPYIKQPLYNAMRKYGISNFKFEVIVDNIDDKNILGELERKYILEYNSHISQSGYNLSWGGEHNQLDGNPRAILTVEDVIEIRTIYSLGKQSVSEVWKEYSDKISYSAFEKIWEGTTWKGVCSEIYTEENKNKQKLFKRNNGSKNGNAIYTDLEVLEFRKFYVNHTLQETYEKFGKRSKSKSSFRGIIDKSYRHLPIYHKNSNKWTLNNVEININDYNPVSTISGSGE